MSEAQATSTPSPAPSVPPAGPEPRVKVRRRRQGTASFHLSNRAVKLSLPDIYRMTEEDCRGFLVNARWGGPHLITCPHCSTQNDSQWRSWDKRWKCRTCRSPFSITSGTVFSSRKISLQDLLAAALLFINSSAGQPALELRRHLRRSYASVFTFQHKLREALMRGYNVGMLNGHVEIDGAQQSGKDSFNRRSVPQLPTAPPSMVSPENLEDEIAREEAKQQAAAAKKAAKKSKKGKKAEAGTEEPTDEYGRRLPEDRRFVINVRKRSGVKGRGALSTRIAVGIAESEEVAVPMLQDFVATREAVLHSDKAKAYLSVGGKFTAHHTVQHTTELSGPNGENNNLSEELNHRLDRAEQGIYLNIEPKYLTDYAVEVAFRSDTRRMSNLDALKLLLNIALNVGRSQYWVGYVHGRHRTYEIRHREHVPAPASGRKKGQPMRPPR